MADLRVRSTTRPCGRARPLLAENKPQRPLEGRPFEGRKAVDRLLQQLKPELDNDQRRQFVDEQVHRCEFFSDERLVIQEFRRRNPGFGDSDANR